MKKSSKRKTIVISSIALILVVLSVIMMLLYLNDNGYLKNEKKLSDEELLQEMNLLYESKDYNTVCNTYDEMFRNRDYKAIFGLNENGNELKKAYQAKYLTALLFTENYNDYSDKMIEFSDELNTSDFNFFCILLFDSLNKETLDNDTKYNELYKKISSVELSFNNQKKESYYTAFLYFAGMCMDVEDIVVRVFEDELRDQTSQMNSDYDEFYAGVRLNYTSNLLELKYYDRFNNIFIKSFGDGTPFSTMDIAFMINNKSYDDEQLSVLHNSIKKLIDEVDIADQNKIAALNSLCEIIEHGRS